MIREVDRVHLENCIKHCPIGIAIVDRDGKWLWVNQEVCSKLGYTEGEMINGMTWMDITPDPNERRADAAEVSDLLSGRKDEYSMVKSYRTKYGRELRCVVTVIPNSDGDDNFLFFWSFIDEIRDIDEFYLRPSPRDATKLAPDAAKIIHELMKEHWVKLLGGLIIAGWLVLTGVFMLGKVYEKFTGTSKASVIQITPELLKKATDK